MNTVADSLRLARLGAGLTGTELAELTGLTQATISRYESGARSPRQDEIEKLAAAVSVTPAFFARDARYRSPIAAEAHMRRPATAKVTDWKRAEARTNMLRIQLEALLEPFDFEPSLYLPLFDPEEDTPEDIAVAVRDQWGMPIGPVDGLIQWLEAAGVFIIEMDLGTARIDGLSQRVGARPVVLLNSRASTDRKRLTLAHELGHLVMHAEYASTSAEAEANAFAAEFLMPSPAIRPYLRSLTPAKLFDLKRLWQVSAQTIIERAYALGRISATERTALHKTFAQRGWRIKEPYSDELRPEKANLLPRIIESLHSAGLQDEDIADRATVSSSNALSLLNMIEAHRLRIVR